MSSEFRKEVKDWLPEHNVRVTFIKKNGEKRVMECTTDPMAVPEEHQPKGVKEDKAETQSVWDLEKKAWRSFRWDSVVQVVVPFTPTEILFKGPKYE